MTTENALLSTLDSTIPPLHEHVRDHTETMSVSSLIGASLALYGASELDDERADAWRDSAIACIEEAVQAMESPFLENGIAGVGFVISLLREHHGLDVSPSLLTAIDDRLLAALGPPDPAQWVELLYGLSGVGVYAATRSKTRSGRKLASEIVRRIEAAERETGPLYEFELPGLDRHENFGVAHGLFGMLGPLYGLATVNARALPLAERVRARIVTMLAESAKRDAKLPLSLIPTAILGDGKHEYSYASRWCYGDLGTLASFVSVSRDVGLRLPPSVRTIATRLERVRLRTETQSYAHATLCHGAIGNALLWRRLAEGLRRPELIAHSEAWFKRGVTLIRRGESIQKNLVGKLDRGSELGSLLSGNAGIAVALLTELGALSPEWDAMLGLRVPQAY